MSGPDLYQATQDAAFAQLAILVPSDLALVRQAVKEDTPPPLVVLGDMDGVPAGGKDERFDRIVLDVHSVFRGASRRGLFAIMAAVRDLDGAELPDTDGVTFSRPRFLSAMTALGEDGVTYLGVTQFEIFAEAA